MFVRQNQQQFRNSNADVQIFYGDGAAGATLFSRSWNKPPGVSHVYMMAIGGGGDGNGTTGGGSGAVTVWYGAAQNVPDSLIVAFGYRSLTRVGYINRVSSSLTILIEARAGTTSGGVAVTENTFTASGFFQSVAGQDGSSTTTSPSSTTFLSGGAATGGSTANYGYSVGASPDGYFQLQPIIVGLGAGGSSSSTPGIGCGGSASGLGSRGMVLIASW